MVLVRTVERRLEDRAENDGRLAIEAAAAQIRAGEDLSNVIVATRTPVFTWVIGPTGRVLYGSAFVPPGFDVATSQSSSGEEMASPAGDIVLFTQRVRGPDGTVTRRRREPARQRATLRRRRSATASGCSRRSSRSASARSRGSSPGARLAAGRGDPHRSARDHGTTMHRRVPVPAGRDEVQPARRDDERDARPARGSIGPAARVRVRRVARAAQPRGVDADRARSRAAGPGSRRTGPTSRPGCSPRTSGSAALVDDLLELARLDEGRRDTTHRRRSTSTSSCSTDVAPPHRRAPVRHRCGHRRARRRQRPAAHASRAQPPRQRGAARSVAPSRSSVAYRRRAGRADRRGRRAGHRAKKTAAASSTGSPASTQAAPATPADPASGLALVKRIVTTHGGTVRVTDGTGPGGARFEVRLPTLDLTGAADGPSSAHHGIATPPLGRSICPVTKLAASETR